jgi:hypothetical protein
MTFQTHLSQGGYFGDYVQQVSSSGLEVVSIHEKTGMWSHRFIGA